MENKDRMIFKKIEDLNKSLRIQATIGEKCLSLVILQESNENLVVYKTSMILEQNLKRLADKLGMNVDIYLEKLISFFENPDTVKFEIYENSLNITEDVNCHLQVKYFQCNLEEVNNSYIGILIDDLYSQASQSKIKCRQLINENDLLHRDITEYKNKLNELVDRKIIDEKTMLGNFVLLLNEKKKKIQHLNELLEAFRNDSSLADPVEVNIAYKNKRKLKNSKSEEQTPQVKEEISESESDDIHYDMMTDEENLVDSTKSDKNYSNYSDIFDESPTEANLTIPKFPKINTSGSSNNIYPSTSKEINSDMELSEENKSTSIELKDAQTMNVDTQEWLDNL